jgi:hypothetical protein
MLLTELTEEADCQRDEPFPLRPLRREDRLQQQLERPLVVALLDCLDDLGQLARGAQLTDQLLGCAGSRQLVEKSSDACGWLGADELADDVAPCGTP